jgi:integrase/recombinase XerD
VTHCRQAMLEELHRRNYAPSTITYYVKNVEQFARYFKRSPDRLTPTHLRTYQAHLLRQRKLAPRTVKLHVCAIRFFFNKTHSGAGTCSKIRRTRRPHGACPRS